LSDITASGLRADFQNALHYGSQVRFRYFNEYNDEDGYDDDIQLVKSGTDFYTSGLLQPIDASKGQIDPILAEQGRVVEGNSVLYVDGNIALSGLFRVGIGSPALGTKEYALIDNGVVGWTIGEEVVYKKLYLRFLTTGSLEQEGGN